MSKPQNPESKPLVANDAESARTKEYGALNENAGRTKFTEDENKYDDDSEYNDSEQSAESAIFTHYNAYFMSFKINRVKQRLEYTDLTDDMEPVINFEVKTDDKNIHKGYVYSHEKEAIEADENDVNESDLWDNYIFSGFCRIMLHSDGKGPYLPKSIAFKIGINKEWSETINYPPELNDKNGWSYTENKMVCDEITEQKKYEKDGYEIYTDTQSSCLMCVETIVIYASDAFPNNENAKKLLKGDIDDWKKVDILEPSEGSVFVVVKKEATDDSDEQKRSVSEEKWIKEKTNLVLRTNVHDMQIYFNESMENSYFSVVYGVKNETVKKAFTFCGEEFKELFEVLDKDEYYCPFNYQNITEPLYICSRYLWIKYKCLYGQDDEFNVFRALCFVSPKNGEQVASRLSVGILCIILQAVLTVGIVYELYRNWDVDEMFENNADPLIMIIAVLVFSFISHIYLGTVDCFYNFYINMHYVCHVSWGIILLDFVSNILIGVTICMISFFYLLQSDTIADAVLNSFALTFIFELDDMANYFEKDEDALMDADWEHLKLGNSQYGDWNGEIKKRSIKLFPQLYTKPTRKQKSTAKAFYNQPAFTTLYSVLGSPLYIFPALSRIVHKTIDFVKTRHGSMKYHLD